MKKTLQSDSVNHIKYVAIPHTTDKQQQLRQQQYSNIQSSSRIQSNSSSSGNSTTYAQYITKFHFRQCILHVPFRHESNLPILR